MCNGVCNAGFADCNGNRQLDGCEVDTRTDPNNCGSCGTLCGASKMCVNGKCV
jgi:hypothetical protein